jgi:hypothetical protein
MAGIAIIDCCAGLILPVANLAEGFPLIVCALISAESFTINLASATRTFLQDDRLLLFLDILSNIKKSKSYI